MRIVKFNAAQNKPERHAFHNRSICIAITYLYTQNTDAAHQARNSQVFRRSWYFYKMSTMLLQQDCVSCSISKFSYFMYSESKVYLSDRQMGGRSDMTMALLFSIHQLHKIPS